MLNSGVCTILWSSGHNLNQERIVFRHSISSSNRNPLFCMSSLFPFPTLMIPYFFPGHLSAPCSQVLLESALKHWSRVRRNVAQDGSGIGLVQGKQILDQPWRAFSGALPSLSDTLFFPVYGAIVHFGMGGCIFSGICAIDIYSTVKKYLWFKKINLKKLLLYKRWSITY